MRAPGRHLLFAPTGTVRDWQRQLRLQPAESRMGCGGGAATSVYHLVSRGRHFSAILRTLGDGVDSTRVESRVRRQRV